MRDAQQVLWGLFAALVSIALIFGVFSLSLAEGGMLPPSPYLLTTTIPNPTKSTLNQLPTMTITLPPSPSWSVSPASLSPTWTPTLFPIPSITQSPEATSCISPPGWLLYTVKSGDTLDNLAVRYKIASAQISQANCLVKIDLVPGMVIYLPPLPTRTPAPCGAPSNWIIYIVQPGDTLYHMGQAYGIPYTIIQQANCLTSTKLTVGQRLYVPPWAPRTPTPTLFFATETPWIIDTSASPGEPTETPSAPPWGDLPTETPTVESLIPTPTDTPATEITP